jgi:catechol 2,3-dioxygenase-like lactoylglutathione lyase family enzyme
MSRRERPIESISAVTLAVSDMRRSVAFYRAMGFDLLAGGEDAPFTTFAVGPGYLNLQLDPEHAPIPAIWGRVVFYVDDVDAAHQRALGAGLSPTTTPADAPWGERYFHLRDPDGHELSFARLL